MLSIIIPMYNSNKYVDSCLGQLLNQKGIEDCEIIVIDDGSKDNTLAKLQDYASQNSQIRVIHQENSGVSSARNRGLDEAKGEWIIFVDSDDVVKPGYIEDIQKEIMTHSEMDVFFWAKEGFVPKKEIDSGSITNIQLLTNALESRAIPEIEDGFILVSVWSKTYRKAFLDQNNIRFRIGIHWAEDLLFNCEVYSKLSGKKFVPRGYYYYNTDNEDSITHSYHKDAIECVKRFQYFQTMILEGRLDDDLVRLAYEHNLWECWEVAMSNIFKAYAKEENLFQSCHRLKEIKQDKDFRVVFEGMQKQRERFTRKARIKASLLKYFPIIFCYFERQCK